MKKLIRTAVVGLGMRGRHLMNVVRRQDEMKLVGLLDPNRSNLDAALGDLTPEQKAEVVTFSSLTELLQHPNLDAVVIATPDHLHEEQAIACLEAGKDLILEKPMALTAEGCRRIVEAQRKAGKVVVIGFVLRYHPFFQAIRSLIDNGAIGTVKTCWMLHSVSWGSDYYFHDWHGLKKYSRGLLLQKGSHDLDIINWMLGSEPVKVSAFGGLDFFGGSMPNDLTCPQCDKKQSCTEAMNGPRIQCAFREEIDVEDNCVVIVEYANKAKASYNECHFTPDYNREFIFVGDKGKMVCDFEKNEITITKRWSNEVTIHRPRTESSGHGGGDDGLVRDFIECVLNGKAPLAGAQAGFESILVAEAAERSIEEGRTIPLGESALRSKAS